MTWVLKVLQFLLHVSVYLPAVIEIHHGHQKPRKSIFILQEYQSSYPPPPFSPLTHRRMQSPQKQRLTLWNTNICVPAVEERENGPSAKSVFRWGRPSVTATKNVNKIQTPRRGNVTGLIDRVPRRLVAPLSKRIWEVICFWREFFPTGFHHQAQKTVFVFFLVLYTRTNLLDFSWNSCILRIQMWHLQEACCTVLHFMFNIKHYESKWSFEDFRKWFALKYTKK